jgi:N-acetylmuramoyl-L-alanine amidase
LKRYLYIFTVAAMLVMTACASTESAANLKLEDGIKSLRITVDPGHGGIDNGATGTKTGVHEDVLNLEIAQMVAKQFMLAGADVLLTRTDENVVYSDMGDTLKRRDMNYRAKIVQEQDPQVLVSIHMNMYPNAKYSGAQTFYAQGNEEGKKLAQCIQEELISGLGDKNSRQIKTGDYFVLKITKNPSALVECGFLSNAAEEKKLSDPEYQKKVANCIFKGICKYLGVQ